MFRWEERSFPVSITWNCSSSFLFLLKSAAESAESLHVLIDTAIFTFFSTPMRQYTDLFTFASAWTSSIPDILWASSILIVTFVGILHGLPRSPAEHTCIKQVRKGLTWLHIFGLDFDTLKGITIQIMSVKWKTELRHEYHTSNRKWNEFQHSIQRCCVLLPKFRQTEG